MSLEAWGDEDPSDSLCAVDGCECTVYPGNDVCKCHGDYFQCELCEGYFPMDAMHIYQCDDCHGDSQCEGE